MATTQRAAERRRLGAYYTPPELVGAVVARAVFPGARSVLDPACGDGRFLRATGLPEQVGVDIDPDTVAGTPYRCADALSLDWGDATFDVVVGNPPFLSPLRAATALPARQGSGGPYADAAAEFLALAVRLVRPCGRVGLVLPQSLLAARDAAPIRALVDERAALRWMWWSPTAMFDAAVRVWAGVWEVGGRPGLVERSFGPRFQPLPPVPAPREWAGLLAGVPAPATHVGPVLGDIATFAADFRDQYYGLVGAVGDDVDGPPLVTSGLIDPGRCRWGERPVRFARRRFAAPRVDLGRLSPPLRAWATRRLVPKILVANQTRAIEAVHDERGEWLPGVPVITCITADPDRVMAVLGSQQANEWVRYHAAGTGLGAGTVRLSPALLASIPVR